MNRYSRLDNTSPAVDQLESDNISVGRSAHDCSHIVCGNAMIGMLTPVLTMEVVLNEDVDINLASLIEFRNPTTRQLFNSFRVYFHGYFNALTDLWEGAKNWLDNGRNGKIMLNRPNLIYHFDWTYSGQDYVVDACTPMSLLNFLGLPPSHMQDDIASGKKRIPLRQFQCSSSGNSNQTVIKLGEYTDYFPADVCMAYQRNWRDFYSNKNLLQNNPFWFPENEEHFILSYECTDAVAIKYGDEDLHSGSFSASAGGKGYAINLTGSNNFKAQSDNDTTPPQNVPYYAAPSNQYTLSPNLSAIKFRQFRGDRFISSSPFPELIRGDIPSITINKESLIDTVQWLSGNDEEYKTSALEQIKRESPSSFADLGFDVGDDFVADGEVYLKVPEVTVTMSDLYTLETLTAFRRKMGMTNGDYSEMMKSQFGVRPKVHSRVGTYIGGFYQDFAISSISQTSESNTTPLGTKAGQGVSSGSGRIGHIHTTDFGWISVYMSIMPDVYYTQGKPRQYSKKSNLEMYFPLFNNLPAQAIRNDELFIQGISSYDSVPFSYEDRYAEFKSLPNRVTGFMGLSHTYASFDASRVLARRFSSVPSFNAKFVSAIPENVDMSVFTVVDEPPFDFSIGFDIRRVFPGPYTAIEGKLSSPNLV